MQTKTKNWLTGVAIAVAIVFILAIIVIWLFSLNHQELPIVSAERAQTISQLNQGQELRPAMGTSTSKLVIVQFADFQCPFCRQSFPTLRKIMTEYQSKVLFVFRNFPLATIHPEAIKAAVAGVCANQQGRFWLFHDLLYSNQDNLNADTINFVAQNAGLKMTEFATCLNSDQAKKIVQEDFDLGNALDVKGTPTFFFNGIRVAGDIPEDIFRRLIEEFLAKDNVR